MKMKKFFCAILSVVFLLGIGAESVFADEELSFEINEYCLDECNLSLGLPSNLTVMWTAMPDDDDCYTGYNFTSKQELLTTYFIPNHLILDAYDFATFCETGNNIHVSMFDTSATGVDDPVLQDDFSANINKQYNMDITPDVKYSLETINDVTYLNAQYAVEGNGFTATGNHYIVVTNDGQLIDIGAISRQKDLSDEYVEIVNGYIDMIMQTVVISNVKTSEGVTDGELSASGMTVKEKTPLEKFNSINFPMWIIVLVVFIVLFVGSSLSKKKEWQEEPFSLDTSKCIQGFCAVAIILHHLAQRFAETADIDALGIFKDIGVMFVGVFFFFSGYGLFKSLKTKDNYLKGFFKKRLPAILVPFYVCILIFVLCAGLTGQQFDAGSLIGSLTGFLLINSHMWYIVEIAVLYLIFFLVFKFIKKENVAITAMGVLTALLTVGSLLLGHGKDMSCRYWFMGEWWYNTTLVFFVGILIAKNEKAILSFAKRFYKLLLPLSIVLTAVFGALTGFALNKYSYWAESPEHMGYAEKFICLSFQLPMVIFAVITLLLVMMKIKFSNPVLKFLGSISLELYLIHNLFLEGLGDNTIANVTGPAIYAVLTVVLSIALATIIHFVDKYVISLIHKKTTCLNIESKRVHSIDCLRFIMAFLVVCIHIPFASTAGDVAIAFGKIAVPFFLVVCGYFLYRDDNNEFFARLKKQTIRILIITVVANVLYGFIFAGAQLYTNGTLDGFSVNFSLAKIRDFLLFNMSPFSEHLWYLGSLLYALVILMILCKTKVHKYVMFASPLLIAGYIVLTWVGSAQYFVYRNAVLVALPYVMMGCLVRRYEDKLMKIKPFILWIVALVLCVTNIVELNVYSRGTGVPFISAELLVYVAVILALKYRDFGKNTLLEKLGSKCTLFIYIAHVVPIMLVTAFIPQSAGFVKYYGPVTVFVVTTLVAVLVKIKYFIPKKTSEPEKTDTVEQKVPEKVNG